MIAMSLSGDTRNVIIEKIFLATDIAPLGIQKDENNPDSYKVLYKFTESVTGNSIFFETRLRCEDELDVSYIESRSIFMDNMKKDEEKMKAFKEMMKDWSNDKFYMGDFNYETENMDYKINGFKQMYTKNNAVVYEHVSIYIPRYMFIILSLYTEDFLNPFNDVEKEFLFIASNMRTMRFEKVEQVKLITSSKFKDENNDCFHYPTMYKMNCGPTFWKFTYDIISQDDFELKMFIPYPEFKEKYSKYDNKLIGVVEDREDVYAVVFNENDKVVALRINNSLIEKTNLKDPYFIFNFPKYLNELFEDENVEGEDKE